MRREEELLPVPPYGDEIERSSLARSRLVRLEKHFFAIEEAARQFPAASPEELYRIADEMVASEEDP